MNDVNGDEGQQPPGDREVHACFDRARELFGRGELDAAEAECVTALSLESDFLPVLELAGVVACQRGDLSTGIDRFRWLTELVPDNPGAHYNLGNALLSAGREAEAVAALGRARKLAADNPEILVAHGMAQRVAGDLAGARSTLEAALALEPKHVAALNALGATLAEAREFEAAAAAFQGALAVDPRSGTLRRNAGQMLLETARYGEAADQFRMALTASGRDTDARAGLAAACGGVGDYDEAIHHYRKALKHDPEHRRAVFGLVDTLERQHRLDEADAVLADALARAPDDPNFRFLEARVAVRRGDDERARALLEALAAEDLPERFSLRLFGELGALLDRAGDAAGAMAACERGNRAAAGQWAAIAPGPNAFRERLGRIREATDADAFATLPDPAFDGEAPIFLAGFPRSGTTLLGRMLDANPALAAVDEVPALVRLADRLDREGRYPGGLNGLSDDEVGELRSDYRAAFPDLGTARLVDKMPLNLVHAPLLRLLFGAAPLVVLTRDPRDVCLSCFMQAFDLNPAMANFHTLESTVATYGEVMGAWEALRERLALAVIDVRFETVLAEPRGTLEALCGKLAVDFDPAMLDFHERRAAPAPIRTPSYRQVTAELSDEGVDRWRRYERWLAPHAAALAPWVERYGYQ